MIHLTLTIEQLEEMFIRAKQADLLRKCFNPKNPKPLRTCPACKNISEDSVCHCENND